MFNIQLNLINIFLILICLIIILVIGDTKVNKTDYILLCGAYILVEVGGEFENAFLMYQMIICAQKK